MFNSKLFDLKIFLTISVIQLFLSPGIHSQLQTPVYLTFITHNEDAEPYNNYNYYALRRNYIRQLADSISSKGAKWNFQSDWRFLQAVINFDTGVVIINTNGKNIIRWLTEDRGIVCDPHSHEANGYNYADVAYLHSQLGITPTKTVGGFLYDTVINNNNWENLENGIFGRVYTSYFWKPDILWGGGTPGHVNDPQISGAWKPQSMQNYFVHDSTKHLTVIGNSCRNKISDTTSVTTAVQRIRNMVNGITYGALPDSGFYTATVHAQIGELNNLRIAKICQFIDSIRTFADQNKVVWRNLNDIYNYWNEVYGKKPFRVTCEDIPVLYSFYDIKIIQEGFYDQSSDQLSQNDTVSVFLRNINSPFAVLDSAKAVIDSLTFTGTFVFFRAPSGSYYIDVKHRNCIETFSKSGGELFIAGSVMSYDFTSSASQAFGNNLKLKGSRYCLYSGDCSDDGIIDLSDLVLISNDASVFTSGYVKTDIDGNNTVDLNDLLVTHNNSINFTEVISP